MLLFTFPLIVLLFANDTVIQSAWSLETITTLGHPINDPSHAT